MEDLRFRVLGFKTWGLGFWDFEGFRATCVQLIG